MNDKDTKNQEQIFSNDSEDQIETPDQMNNYVRVATPRTWMIAIALLLLLAALLLWGFLGKIPQSTKVVGVGAMDTNTIYSGEEVPYDTPVNHVLCFVDPEEISVHQLDGKDATVTFNDGRKAHGLTYVTESTPYSKERAEDILEHYFLNDPWVESRLDAPDEDTYRCIVDVILDEDLDHLYSGEFADVYIVTRLDPPVTFLFQ